MTTTTSYALLRKSPNEYLFISGCDSDDHVASRRNSVNLDMMQSALIAHSGPPSVAASSVHGGETASVATAATAAEVDLIQSAVELVSQVWICFKVHIR